MKIRQLARCVDACGTGVLELNKVYEVLREYPTAENVFVRIRDLDTKDVIDGYFKSRFEFLPKYEEM